MLLLNTESFELRYSTDPPPKYSVFSHAQVSGDICFEDFKYPEMLSCKVGFHRLQEACIRAGNYGSYWLWTDAVCIDKSSSAAFSEAFNNLSRIYQDCTFSLIYLEDFAPDECTDKNMEERLAACSWTRNVWVLPQLVFPRIAFFYDSAWNEIGTKATLAPQLSSATSINQSVLEDPATLQEYSVAKRISWASNLQASQIDVWSFSLLGILGVNMPVMYGEGWKTFIRLQEEILRNTSDFSLFAWRPEHPYGYRGIFARSPTEFRHFQRGPSGPFRMTGDVHVTAAGVIVRAYFRKMGDDLVLPLKGSDGSVYSIKLSKCGKHFVRQCHAGESIFDHAPWPAHISGMNSQMHAQLQDQETDHGIDMRICVKRDLATLDWGSTGELQPETRTSEQEPLSPGDSGTSSPWEAVVTILPRQPRRKTLTTKVHLSRA